MEFRFWIVAAVLFSVFAVGAYVNNVARANDVLALDSALQKACARQLRCECPCDPGVEQFINYERHWRDPPDWIEKLGLSSTGSLVQGLTWNPDNPDNRFNDPVSYNDRSNDYQLQQLYVFAEAPAQRANGKPGLGGRVDWLFGSNSRFLLARGLDDNWRTSQLYGFAMPQVYAEAYLPVGDGLSVKMGKFYGLIGYASDRALDRFFYSFANISYAEPATHTGVLASLRTDENWVLQAGITRGWDNWEDNNNKLGVTGGVVWNSQDGQSFVNFAFHSGPEDDAGQNNRFVYSLVAQFPLTQRLTWLLHHDYFWEDDGAVDPNGNLHDAEGYGLTMHLIFEMNDAWAVGFRVEWFRDDDGVIVTPINSGINPGAGDYYSATLAANWKVSENFTLRSEARWDWSSGGIFPFDNLSDMNQFLLGVQAIVRLW